MPELEYWFYVRRTTNEIRSKECGPTAPDSWREMFVCVVHKEKWDTAKVPEMDKVEEFVFPGYTYWWNHQTRSVDAKAAKEPII